MPDAPPEVVMIQPMPAGQPAAAGERAATDWVELARSFQALPRRPICAPANLANEIVVCAPLPQRPYEGPVFVQEGPIGDQIGDKLHARVGGVELGSIADEHGERVLGARIRF